MKRLPNIHSLLKPTGHDINQHHHPLAFPSMGNRYSGTFSTSTGGVKFLLVAVDYFTKWIEAEPLANVTVKQMIKFMTTNNLDRFGTPKILISDNDTQFEGSPFKEWCVYKRIHCQLTLVAHPQANKQTEILNKTIVNGLKKGYSGQSLPGWMNSRMCCGHTIPQQGQVQRKPHLS